MLNLPEDTTHVVRANKGQSLRADGSRNLTLCMAVSGSSDCYVWMRLKASRTSHPLHWEKLQHGLESAVRSLKHEGELILVTANATAVFLEV
jgi:hypothetical protein